MTGRQPAVLVSDTTAPADIHGVHGAVGLTWWKCLAGARDLAAECEAVEWASVPPGGVSGEHRHTRTEESYFVIRGEGLMALDGSPVPVHAGSLILTGLDTVHGLVNTGSTNLDWLVIEVRSPHTSAALRGDTGSTPPAVPRPTEDHVNAKVYDLNQGRVDATAFLTGPLEILETVDLRGDSTWELDAATSEHTVFVLSGTGWAVVQTGHVPLRPGVALTLPHGTSTRLGADAEGMRLFHAELAVPAARMGDR
ncbi:cupin domain-containing protein [Sphaerimonospora cavernae]|uniref:Cupin domain-containing protein n=1 Tax=Sphaerimonospora cavernae TaxID=1740611 RepID=A0ABV6UCI4_9ACTN